MTQKTKYGIIPLCYIIGIYISSLLLVFFIPMQQKNYGPSGAIFVLYESLGLNDKAFEVFVLTVWISQFVAISVVTLFVINNLRVIETDKRLVPYAILASIFYQISGLLIAYEYLVVPLNKYVYCVEARVMGPIGFIEDFVAEMIVCLPLFILTSLILRMKYKTKIGLVVANVIVFISIFVLNRLTTDLWFPPLINYGS